MTRDRLKHCLRTIQRPTPLSQRGLAAWVGFNERQVRRWVSDDDYGDIPADVEAWLETVTACFESEEVAAALATINAILESHPPPAKPQNSC